jgi:hypothetical protein
MENRSLLSRPNVKKIHDHSVRSTVVEARSTHLLIYYFIAEKVEIHGIERDILRYTKDVYDLSSFIHVILLRQLHKGTRDSQDK